ncbi:MAG TPA: hypothetical protein VHY56_06675 [Candidatus Binataceae bacterium]|nr:hypothetical protein [Candidatus Binataceae bacterium]
MPLSEFDTGVGGLDVRIGSVEHRDLICGEFINGFKSYEVGELRWPELDRASASHIRAMPFWDDALRAEQSAADRARRMAKAEPDHALREALTLVSYEKSRAARLIENLMQRYGIKLQRVRHMRPRGPEWGYMRNGFAELFDMLPAFGLFRLGAQAQFLPAALIAIFEELMAEEARHLIFFHNWAILKSRRAPFHHRPLVMVRRAAGLTLSTLGHLRSGVRIATGRPFKEPSGSFVMWAPSRLLGDTINLRGFIEIGLSEFDRRMAIFDPSLPRPWLAPSLFRLALHLLPNQREHDVRIPGAAPATWISVR